MLQKARSPVKLVVHHRMSKILTYVVSVAMHGSTHAIQVLRWIAASRCASNTNRGQHNPGRGLNPSCYLNHSISLRFSNRMHCMKSGDFLA